MKAKKTVLLLPLPPTVIPKNGFFSIAAVGDECYLHVLILDFTCRLLFRDTLASLFSTFCFCTVELSADELDGSDHHGLFSMSNNLTALRILVLRDAFNA